MARRLLFGRHLSPFAPLEDTEGIHTCYCSTFIKESGQTSTIPRYIASAYHGGEIRFHDTLALTQSTSDGIAASHFYEFQPSDIPIVRLKTIESSSGTLLLLLEEFGNLSGVKTDEILTSRDADALSSKPQNAFCIFYDTMPAMTCFTVDETQKRIFTGGVDGTWRYWDLEWLTAMSTSNPISPQKYKAHERGILDGDYNNDLLASASEDGSVCVWDVRSQSCVCAFNPASGKHLPLNQSQRSSRCSHDPCLSVRFDKTGRHVIAASRQKRITVWNIRADSVQCSIQTDQIPYMVDTANEFIFFSNARRDIWRYSMYNTEMRHIETSTSDIHHLHVDRTAQQSIVISGGANTVELLNLEGASLGKAVRKRALLWRDSAQRDPHSQAESLSTMDDLCDMDSDMLSVDEQEDGYVDDGFVVEDDEMSGDFVFPHANDDGHLSSEDLEDLESDFAGENDVVDEMLIPVDMDETALDPYGYTSDSEISPVYDLVLRNAHEFNNCESSTSQSETGFSDEEDEDDEDDEE